MILNLWGISFAAVVVFSLGPAFFKLMSDEVVLKSTPNFCQANSAQCSERTLARSDTEA